jgi:hypothetical protein
LRPLSTSLEKRSQRRAKIVERSLHRQLKERYGPEIGGRSEVVLGEFRVDALAPDGRLIEIQSGPLGLLKRKLARLLPSFEIGVVKPVIVARRVIRRDEPGGIDLGSRRSPRRGSLLDAFDELVGLARLFPHENLRIDLVAVEVDEIRVPRRRKPGYLVVDRILREVVETVQLRDGHDLWSLLPVDLEEMFTTEELALRIGRPIAFAQRVAYCLRLCGAVEVVAKVGNRRVYSRATVASLG